MIKCEICKEEITKHDRKNLQAVITKDGKPVHVVCLAKISPIADYEYDPIEYSIALLLQAFESEFGVDITTENFIETSKRVSRAYRELLSGEVDTNKQIDEILNKSFPTKYGGMVVAANVESFSLCPHHLLPVSYVTNIGYIPNERVLGISKLVRIVDLLSKRLVLQETLTTDITEALMRLNPQGIIIQIYGKHGCMGCRGVKQPQVTTMTSEIRGAFKTPEVREEFGLLIKNLKNE